MNHKQDHHDRMREAGSSSPASSFHFRCLAVIEGLMRRHADLIQPGQLMSAGSAALKTVMHAARWFHLALERGGRFFLVLPEHPVEREFVRSWVQSTGGGMGMRPVMPRCGQDESAGRAAFRRLRPGPHDLVLVTALPDVSPYVVGILKEANMWHSEPVLFTDGSLPRSLKALSEIRVSIRNLNLELFHQRRMTQLIPFSPRRRAVPHKPTGSTDTP